MSKSIRSNGGGVGAGVLVDVEVAVVRGVAHGSWVGDGSGVEVDRAVGVCVGRGASGSQRTGTGFK